MREQTKVSVYMPDELHKKLKHRAVDLGVSLQSIITGASEALFDSTGQNSQIPAEGVFVCFRQNGELIVKPFDKVMHDALEKVLEESRRQQTTNNSNIAIPNPK